MRCLLVYQCHAFMSALHDAILSIYLYRSHCLPVRLKMIVVTHSALD